jgi:hypothetical protein
MIENIVLGALLSECFGYPSYYNYKMPNERKLANVCDDYYSSCYDEDYGMVYDQYYGSISYMDT